MTDRTKLETPTDDERLAALHEAGHAVVGVVLGCDVERVDIVHRPRKGWGGATHSRPETPTQDVLVGLGGVCAEYVDGKRTTWSGSVDARMVAEVVGPEGVRLARRVVIPLLRMHWPAVLAVRDRLLAKKVVRKRELRRVVWEALAGPPPKKRTRRSSSGA